MKITKEALKQLIREELGAAGGPRSRTEVPGHGRPGPPDPMADPGKPDLSRDEQIVQWATQIVSITQTSKNLNAIAELAEDIIESAGGADYDWTREGI